MSTSLEIERNRDKKGKSSTQLYVAAYSYTGYNSPDIQKEEL